MGGATWAFGAPILFTCRHNTRPSYNRDPMSKINWSRVLGCGLLAGVVWIVLGSAVTALLGRDFATLPNNRLGSPTPNFVALNVGIDLLEGISILWLLCSPPATLRRRRDDGSDRRFSPGG